eukprot:9787-Rhodomonas_salina.1
MVNALNHCIEHATGDDNVDWAPLANVFLDFFLCVFSGYRRHVRWDQPTRSLVLTPRTVLLRQATFDKESFVKSHRKNICKFLGRYPSTAHVLWAPSRFTVLVVSRVLVRQSLTCAYCRCSTASDPGTGADRACACLGTAAEFEHSQMYE